MLKEIETQKIKLADISDKRLDELWFFIVDKLIIRFDISSQEIPINSGDFVKYIRQMEKTDPDNYKRLEEVVNLYLGFNSKL